MNTPYYTERHSTGQEIRCGDATTMLSLQDRLVEVAYVTIAHYELREEYCLLPPKALPFYY